jgi:2,4-diketo-3-deoxy-L-fuconate hydrolase
MKLIRWGAADQEKTGVIINDTWYDTSAFGEDYNEQFFHEQRPGKIVCFCKSQRNGIALTVILQDTRLGSPVARPSKIVCIGLNYADHARRKRMQPLPPEPVIFMKSTTALTGPFDDIIIPKNSVKDRLGSRTCSSYR